MDSQEYHGALNHWRDPSGKMDPQDIFISSIFLVDILKVVDLTKNIAQMTWTLNIPFLTYNFLPYHWTTDFFMYYVCDMSVCMYVCIHVRMHVSLYVFVYICTFIYIHICVCVSSFDITWFKIKVTVYSYNRLNLSILFRHVRWNRNSACKELDIFF